jgi:hypothetical protein
LLAIESSLGNNNKVVGESMGFPESPGTPLLDD